MTMTLLEIMRTSAVIPVIAIDEPEHAVPLARALVAGGIGMLNAIYGPLPDITFCPTGGISQDTASQFLALKNVACVGGSWLTPKDAIAAGNWDRITELAKAASGLKS